MSVIPGIGKITEARLAEAGIRLVSDLIAQSAAERQRLLGDAGPALLALARGEDTDTVDPTAAVAQSYSTQETFNHNSSDFSLIEQVTKRMIDELMPKIRAEGKQAKTITIKIRYPGMEDRSSARSLAVGSDLETSFYPLVSQLLQAAWTEPRPLRLVGVRFSGIEQPSRQLEIFGEVADKKRRLAGVLDKLNARGPLPAVHSGHQLGPPPS